MNFYDTIETYLKNDMRKNHRKWKKRECWELPTMRECEPAIKCMKNNKSPGQDGRIL